MDTLVERLIDFAYFAGQALVIVVALIVILGFLFNLAQRSQKKTEIEVENLNEKYESLKEALLFSSFDKKERKAHLKAKKKEEKAEKEREKKEKKEKKDKKEEKSSPSKKRLFVIDFEGDTKAAAVDQLREEVSAILSLAEENDEVMARVESPGGVVHGYGLAAAQLARFKDKNIRLTVCVDKVAASGGYMMACVADEIVAAPFAILGSIGVIAQVPNFHRILKKNDVDYREFTSGEFKRTISLLGEMTEKGEKKFLEQIVDTHELFKEFVGKNRPQVDMSQVATGEYWFGTRALDLKLADRLLTSDDFIMSALKDFEIKKVKFEEKKKLAEKIGLAASAGLNRSIEFAWEKLHRQSLI